jgi:hypothetical protein
MVCYFFGNKPIDNKKILAYHDFGWTKVESQLSRRYHTIGRKTRETEFNYTPSYYEKSVRK